MVSKRYNQEGSERVIMSGRIVPEVRAAKDARGRTRGYYAQIGPVVVEGASKQDAAARCVSAAESALKRLDRGTLIGRFHGALYVVSPTEEGSYWIEGYALDHRVSGTHPDRESAQDAALHHLAQNLWTHEIGDAESFLVGLPPKVATEIRGWIRFQREYRAARDRGLTDHEAHRAACEASS